jgi:hypothetical protein
MFRRCIVVLGLISAAACSGDEPPRPPEEVARELLEVYGERLDEATYIPALAVYCRWRFGELTREKKYTDEVRELVAPYSRGEKKAKTDSQVALAGHLAFVTQLPDPYRRKGSQPDDGKEEDRAGFRKLIFAAADTLFKPDSKDHIRSPKREEMSDAVFMCGPILSEAGAKVERTPSNERGTRKYTAAASDYLLEMSKLRQRADGLYAHGHLCDVAWGRGNGFPAVGAAWCLSNSLNDDVLRNYRRHLAELRKHQDRDGMWHQVIDHPESGPEFTCTAMIGFAMQQGISRGWLPKTYQPSVDKAWQAICRRIEPRGKLLGVCESTGTQKSLEDYLARKLNDGVDHRGGAMALLFATERLAAEKTATRE